MPNQFELAEAYTELTLRGRSKFHADIRGVTASLKTLQTHMEGVARHARRMLLVGGGALAAMVKFASDAAETQSKFNAVFRENADAARAWTRELGAAVGRSKFAIENTLASFQAFFVGMGFGSQQALDLSKKMQKLAIDFGSFHNLADAEASQRFISALSGSSEVLDMFGINIKQAALQQELYRMGVEKSVLAASEQEKTLARVSVIFRAMGEQGAIGDAVRTSGQLANQMRMLKDRFMEVSVEIGSAFIPLLQRAVSALAEMLKGMKDMDAATKDTIVRWTLFLGSLAGFLVIAPKLIALIRGFGAAMVLLSGAVGAGSLLAGGIGALVIALGGLGAAFVAASAKGEGFGEFLGNLVGDITGASDSAKGLAADLEELEKLRTKPPKPAPTEEPAEEPAGPGTAEQAAWETEKDLRDRLQKARQILRAAEATLKDELAQQPQQVLAAPNITSAWLIKKVFGKGSGTPSDLFARHVARPGADRPDAGGAEAEKRWDEMSFWEKLTAEPVSKERREKQWRVRAAQRVVDELRGEVGEATEATWQASRTDDKGAAKAARDAATKQTMEELAKQLFGAFTRGIPKVEGFLQDMRERDELKAMGPILDLKREISEAGKGAEMAERLKGASPRLRDRFATQTMGMADVNQFLQRVVTKSEDEGTHQRLDKVVAGQAQQLAATKEIQRGWA